MLTLRRHDGPKEEEVVAAVAAAVDSLLAGRFDEVPDGVHPIEQELHRLAVGLQEKAARDMDRTVEFSVGVVEQVIAAAEMAGGAEEIDERLQAIAAAAEELSVTSHALTTSVQTADTTTEASRQAAQEGAAAATSTATHMRNLVTAVSDSSAKTSRLDTTSAELEQVVRGIREMADQTSLLALNATIEAARAGEAGKGFAVVAGEVKDLAVRSAEATEAGSKIIARLQAEMREISGVMDQCVELAEGSEGVLAANAEAMATIVENTGSASQEMETIRGVLADQQVASTEVTQSAAVIAEMSHRSLEQIDRLAEASSATEAGVVADCNEYMELDIPDKVVRVAKVDHMVWRRKLATMAIGREALNPDELADHHSCRLGKWYDTADEQYRTADAFKELADPHALVHRHGIAAARAYANGDHETTLREIRQVGTASVGVIRLLDELIG